MVARVLQGVVSEGKMEEVIQMIQENLGPVVKDRPGFESLLLLTHAGTGQAISISLWENTEALEAGEMSGFLDSQLEQVLPLLEEAPSSRTFRVSGLV